MKYTTKTVVGTISALMIVGMITSFVSSSETYFFGQKSLDGTISLRAVPHRSIAQDLQTSVLTTESIDTAAPRERKLPRVPTPRTTQSAPRSCSEQNLYTYTGADNGSLLYGMCIPCPMTAFDVQKKTCTLN